MVGYLNQVLLGFTGFFWVFLGFPEFQVDDWVPSAGFTGFDWDLMGCTGFQVDGWVPLVAFPAVSPRAWTQDRRTLSVWP